MTLDQLLRAIPSTEPASFGELLDALGSDKPTSREEYREMFVLLELADSQGLVEVDREDVAQINTVQLTEAGAARVRAERTR